METKMKQKPMTIGLLAKACGVNIETIRYYQRIDLITEPNKPAQGYRSYSLDTVNRIKFIKRAQQLGFNLSEISGLLQLDEGKCVDVRHRAEEKRRQIERQISDLQNLHKTLSKLIKSCKRNSKNSHCAIIETLSAS